MEAEIFKVALPNKGALSEGAVEILKEAGYECKRHSRELVVRDSRHSIEFIFLRPRDIAIYVGNGLISAGITGRDLAMDSGAPVQERLGLNFGRSRFCYAVPKGCGWSVKDLAGKRIATSYGRIVEKDMAPRGGAKVVRLDGAVEISIQLGVADAIADVVESGRTLIEAGLEVIGDPVLRSEAILISRQEEESETFHRMIRRLEGILVARSYVLLEYVIPEERLMEGCALTPGVKSPTVSPVSERGWVAVAAMVKVKGLNSIIDGLSDIGAKGIIAHDIRTCRL